MAKNKLNNDKNNFTVCPECGKKYPRETVGKCIPICDKKGNKLGGLEICVCKTCHQIYKLTE